MASDSYSLFGGKGLLVSAPDAFRAGSYLFLSARYGASLENGVVPRRAEDLPEKARKMFSSSRHIDALEWPVTAQVWWIYEAFRRILKPLGADLNNLVRTNTYFRDLDDFNEMELTRAVLLPVDPPPSTVLEVPFGLLPGGADILIEGVAVLPGGPPKEAIRSKLGAGYHFCWGIRTGDMVWASGQTATHPIKGEYITRPEEMDLEKRHFVTHNLHMDRRGGAATAQAWMAYWRVRQILKDGGADMEDILHEKIYLRSMKHLPAVERFRRDLCPQPDSAPPRVYLQMANMGRTNECLLEVDVIASLKGRKAIGGRTDGLGRLGAAGCFGGPFFSLGGRVARDPTTGDVIRSAEELGERRSALDGETDPLAIQALWIYLDIEQFLKENGSSLGQLAKVDIYVREPAKLSALDTVHRAVFPGDSPAISIVPVVWLDPDPDVCVKISGFALRPER